MEETTFHTGNLLLMKCADTIFNSLNEGVIITEIDFTVTYINDTCRRFFQFDENIASGIKLTELFRINGFQKYINGHEHPYVLDDETLTFHVNDADFIMKLQKLEADNGTICGWVAIIDKLSIYNMDEHIEEEILESVGATKTAINNTAKARIIPLPRRPQRYLYNQPARAVNFFKSEIRGLPEKSIFNNMPIASISDLPLTEMSDCCLPFHNSLKEYEKLFDNINDAVAIIDQNYRYLHVNKAFLQLKQKNRDEIIGEKAGEISGMKADNIYNKKFLNRCMKGETLSRETVFSLPSQEEKYLEVKYYPIMPMEDVVGIAVVFFDITNQRNIEKALKDSIKEQSILLREIHHRVKNNLQVISSLLSIQSRQISDERLNKVFTDCQNRICSMAFIHQQLYQSKSFTHVDMNSYLQDISSHLRQLFHVKGREITFAIETRDTTLDINRAIPCGLIINEIVTNCFKHAFPGINKGEIIIKLFHKKKDIYLLSISDNGIGLPKAINIEKAGSLGLTLIKTLTNQLSGKLKVYRKKGTQFVVTFPAL